MKKSIIKKLMKNLEVAYVYEDGHAILKYTKTTIINGVKTDVEYVRLIEKFVTVRHAQGNETGFQRMILEPSLVRLILECDFDYLTVWKNNYTDKIKSLGLSQRTLVLRRNGETFSNRDESVSFSYISELTSGEFTFQYSDDKYPVACYETLTQVIDNYRWGMTQIVEKYESVKAVA